MFSLLLKDLISDFYLVARLDACPPGIQSRVRSSGLATFFMEIGHEIIPLAILSLPLIQVGQLSVTG